MKIFLQIWLCLLFSTQIICFSSNDVILNVNITNSPVFIIGEKFFSVALDTAVVAEHFYNFNFTKSQRLINLVKLLSPGYFRIGGNQADRLHFSKDETITKKFNSFSMENFSCIYDDKIDCVYDFPNFTMSGDEWKKINKFVEKVDTKMLFDLNCLIRYENGSWNATNAEELISFSNSQGFNIDWQLGNEPNAFKHVFNYDVNATQLAKDFIKLRNILNKYPRYKSSLLVGPDVTRPQIKKPESKKYLKKFLNFLKVNQNRVIDAIAVHQYYLNGRTATISDFLDSKVLELLPQQIQIAKNISKKYKYFKNTPIWITETSSAYGGGAPGLSNRFVGSFLWLDKLGITAKHGIQIVIRQSIFKNNYALIDDDYNPTPDWWLSIIFNKLVGKEVLDCNVKGSEKIRLYCHCSIKDNEKTPSVIIYGLNLSNESKSVQITGLDMVYEKNYEYVLTAFNQNLTSKNVLLNGELLQLKNDDSLPIINGRNINVNKPLKIPGYSLIFWKVSAMNAKICI